MRVAFKSWAILVAFAMGAAIAQAQGYPGPSVVYVAGGVSATVSAALSPASVILSGQNSCVLTTSGTWVGSATVDGTNDFATYTPITTINSGNPVTTDTTASGIIAPGVLGKVAVAFTVTSGTIGYTLICSTAGASSGGGGPITLPFAMNTASPHSGATAAGIGVLGLVTGTTTVAPLSVNASGQAIVVGAGTAGSAAAGVVTVQGILGGVPVPVTGTFTATTSFPYNGAQAQSAQTVSAIGVVGQYFSSSPTLGNSQVNPLALDASGNLLGNAEICDTATRTTCAKVVAGNSSPSSSENVIPVQAVVAGYTTSGIFSFNLSDLESGVGGGTNGILITATGGVLKTSLTSASATACTSIEVNTVGRYIGMYESGGATETSTLTIYDEGASPSCVAADAIESGIPGATSTNRNVRLSAGLAYKLSAALTGTVVITRN